MSIPTQASYAQIFTTAFAGMLGDFPDARVESAVNGESVNVPAGIFMAEGATDRTAKLLTAATGAGAKLIGAVINTFMRNPGDADTTLSGALDAYTPQKTMPMLTRGTFWCVSESAFAVGDDVFVRHTVNGGLTQKGAVTSGAGVTTGCRKVTGARVLRASTAAGIVLLEIDVNVDRATV
jgi:hypothetical protein